MVRLLVSATRGLAIALAVLVVAFAVQSWRWFRALPGYAPARRCGNCFFAAVGVPTELALVGLLVIAILLLKIPSRADDILYWICAVAGVLLTPMVVGVPPFAFAFLVLTHRCLSAVFKANAAYA